MTPPLRYPEGTGLGLRLGMLGELFVDGQPRPPPEIGFFEIAPENWMDMGGARGRILCALTERHTFVGHGLALDLAGYAPLDIAHLHAIRRFLDEHHIGLYTEHLSYTRDGGHLHELLPVPRTEEAVSHVAARIRIAQDTLGQRIGIENASTYVGTPLDAMTEDDFVVAVTEEADCDLHLDVNNVYVNGINHGHDPLAWIDRVAERIPGRVVYLHIAGHRRLAEDFIVDSHGEAVADPVWALLDHTYASLGVRPTLLERDYEIPPIAELLPELRHIQALQTRHAGWA